MSVVNEFSVILDKVEALVKSYGPATVDLAAEVIRVNAIQRIIAAGLWLTFGLFLIGVGIFCYRMTKKIERTKTDEGAARDKWIDTAGRLQRAYQALKHPREDSKEGYFAALQAYDNHYLTTCPDVQSRETELGWCIGLSVVAPLVGTIIVLCHAIGTFADPWLYVALNDPKLALAKQAFDAVTG